MPCLHRTCNPAEEILQNLNVNYSGKKSEVTETQEVNGILAGLSERCRGDIPSPRLGDPCILSRVI